MAIMTRALGRTGANVTILGYGAMELRRGPPANAVFGDGINPMEAHSG